MALADPAEVRMWGHQLLAMTRLSVLRGMRTPNTRINVALLLLPVLIAMLAAVVFMVASRFGFTDPLVLRPNFSLPKTALTAEGSLRIFENLMLYGLMNFAVFFAALNFAYSTLREEVDERTLHHLMLQPIPRWIIVAGKYLAFLAVAVPAVAFSMVLTRIVLLVPYGPGPAARTLFSAAESIGMVRTFAALTCGLMLYSALFLGLSTVFRNLAFALFFYGWESGLNYLPGVMKNFNLRWYLRELLPTTAETNTSAVSLMNDPPGAIQTIIVFAIIFLGGVGLAGFMMNHRQCVYGSNA